MKTALLFNFTIDKTTKKVVVEREFNASLSNVWKAWTSPKLLDQWWAPKPYKTETTDHQFIEGGFWHYKMVSPEGEAHLCLANYIAIQPTTLLKWENGFADAEWNLSPEFPSTIWKITFSNTNGKTKAQIEIQHQKIEDIELFISMGFKEGFSAALGNLDELVTTL